MLSISGKILINGIDLTLDHGPITVLMGPNGAGKSLLLRLLHGLIKPSSGTIRCAEQPIGPQQIYRQAMVFQRPVLLRRSVAANIDFVLKLRKLSDPQYRTEMLSLVGLQDKARQAARLLSGGEQQRLALAQALASQPDILFLDEPTANLDPTSTHMIEKIVERVHRRGTKIILISHDAGQARRLGDEIVFMNHGKVVEHSPAERFFSEPESKDARDYLSGRLVF